MSESNIQGKAPAYKWWTPEETEKLITLRENRVPLRIIRQELDRTKDAILNRLKLLRYKGLYNRSLPHKPKSNNQPKRKEQEIKRLQYLETRKLLELEVKKLHERGLTHGQIALKMKLGRGQISGMVRKMIDDGTLPPRGKPGSSIWKEMRTEKSDATTNN